MKALVLTLLAGCQIAMPSRSPVVARTAPAPAQDAPATSVASSSHAPDPHAPENPHARTAPEPEPITTPDPRPTVPDGHAVIPNITGMTLDQARAALAKAGFTGSIDEHPASLECERSRKQVGTIDCQFPNAGAFRAVDFRVQVVVYDGRVRRHLTPDQLKSVVGMTVDEAQAKLREMGLPEPCGIQHDDIYPRCAPGTVCAVLGDYTRCSFSLKPEIKIAVPQ